MQNSSVCVCDPYTIWSFLSHHHKLKDLNQDKNSLNNLNPKLQKRKKEEVGLAERVTCHWPKWVNFGRTPLFDTEDH